MKVAFKFQTDLLDFLITDCDYVTSNIQLFKASKNLESSKIETLESLTIIKVVEIDFTVSPLIIIKKLEQVYLDFTDSILTYLALNSIKYNKARFTPFDKVYSNFAKNLLAK